MHTILYYAVPNTYYTTVPLERYYTIVYTILYYATLSIYRTVPLERDITLQYTLYSAVPNAYYSTVPLEREILYYSIHYTVLYLTHSTVQYL